MILFSRDKLSPSWKTVSLRFLHEDSFSLTLCVMKAPSLASLKWLYLRTDDTRFGQLECSRCTCINSWRGREPIERRMGILMSKMNVFHKSKPLRPLTATPFSWDTRRNDSVTPASNYLLENLKNSTEYRKAGSVSGQQFIVQNCDSCNIFVLDYANTVIIDDCNECTMIFGPVERSVFCRHSQNCRIIVACEQFRLRDCKNLEISLYCATRPIIESSTSIKFACLQLFYGGIQDHLNACNLNVWNNMWYKIYDYTPANKNDFPNWSFGEMDAANILENLPEEVKQLNVSTSQDTSIVPLTLGALRNTSDQQENCLVIFCDDYSAKCFLRSINRDEINLVLIKSRQTEITARHAETLFFTSSLVNAVQHSPVIGLYMYGKNAINVCSRVINETSETSLYYVSPTTNMASHQVNTFFSIVDLQAECYN